MGSEQAQRRPTTQDLKTNTNRKKQKTTRKQQNREKERKVPKTGKTETRGARPVQAGHHRGRGVGRSMRWGCMKDLVAGGESTTQIGSDQKQNLGGRV